MKQIDFTLYTDKAATKTFTFTNQDGTIYDMSGSTVVLKLYLTPGTPTDISCNVALLTGKVTCNFNAVHTDNVGIYEYVLEETKQDTSTVPLVMGNIAMVEYVPFSLSIQSFLDSELPANVSLSQDFVMQRITYWKLFLCSGFNVAESAIHVDASWTSLQNALFAKLVAYDALMLAAKGSMMQFLGGDYTQTTGGGGAISKIETGPSNVEFFPVGDSIEQLFKAGPDGSAFDSMISDICGLSSKLGIKLPMCKQRNNVVGPRYYQNTDWLRITEESRVASQASSEETTI